MREMRRKDRALTDEAAWEIVESSDFGTLSMLTEDNTPYCVPLNFVRKGDCLYFHCAKEGWKTELLRNNSAVCVSFVSKAAIDAAALTTKFASATLFGTAEEVTEDSERSEVLTLIARRFAPDHKAAAEKELKYLPVTALWRIKVTHITGKSNIQK